MISVSADMFLLCCELVDAVLLHSVTHIWYVMHSEGLSQNVPVVAWQTIYSVHIQSKQLYFQVTMLLKTSDTCTFN
jgi:hypothetical protein